MILDELMSDGIKEEYKGKKPAKIIAFTDFLRYKMPDSENKREIKKNHIRRPESQSASNYFG